MASPTVLTFDAKGRAVDFEVWVDDLQLNLQCNSRDRVSLFDHTFGASLVPASDADSTVRSQWTTRDAVARLAVCSHQPSVERAHFGQYKTAKSLYDVVVARYSSPATAALSRLMMPYLFPDLATFATVADLITHLRTSHTRYTAALPSEFRAKILPPPMYITLFYLVTRLPNSLRSVRDHFLSLCHTELTVNLLEERLTASETSIVAVRASRGDPRAPFFEGCYPVPLLPSVASAAAVDLVGIKEVRAASAPSGRRRSGKGKGDNGGGGDGGGGVGGGGGGRGGGGGGGRGGGSGGVGGGGGGGGRQRQRQWRWRRRAKGDCYLCMLPDLGIEAAALGASESAPPSTSESALSGRQRPAPHFSEFPSTEAPLLTLHMDVWGPTRVRGQDHERYFLLVVDDYSHYTTVFPLCRKGEVTEVLIIWIRAARG
ncbi:unnamed protein product [Closterium sp. NIES-64]|nr:unnamed protein product [Closterium sp. NIES-64]